ncbi:MAG: beta-N-acetylhexosaminidase [Spirochaetes bacterium]|nr:beta-N-acetylhexosaminidase [Spirochaetota bacterium]
MKKMIILVLLFLFSCRDKMYKEAEQIVQSMTLDHKIGQMMMVGVAGKNVTEDTVSMLKKYKPGGIILFGYNIADKGSLQNFIGDLQKKAFEEYSIPLLISLDQEGGRVKRITDGITQFPGNMAFGVANDESALFNSGRILGIQLRNTGVNINLAPVLDVNNNPYNPVINTRSFGSDVKIVSRMGKAYITGMQQAGCISVAKHFPGHGDTDKDSHHVLPVIKHDIERLKKVEFPPFAAAVENDVEAVMTAHISYPNVLDNNMPATLSDVFLKTILREEMKFEGIIITDDMEMNAVSKQMNIGESAVKSVEAGGDIILISTHGENIDLIAVSLKNAVYDGRLSMERIDNSVKRIIELKLRYRILGLEKGKIKTAEWTYNEEELCVLKEAEKINSEISRQAIYYFPSIQKEQAALKFDDLSMDESEKKLDHFNHHRMFIASNDNFINEIKELFSNKISYSFFTENSFLKYISKKKGRTQKQMLGFKNSILYYQFDNADSKTISILYKECRRRGIKFVLLCTGNPFLLNDVKEVPPAFLTFSNTDESIHQLILCLKGEFKAKEKINVSLGFN